MATNKIQEPLDSRYKDTPVLIASDGTVFYDLWVEPSIDNSASMSTDIVRGEGRLDLLAYNRLSNQRMWWLIASLNKMIDQVEDTEEGQTVNIPRRIVSDAVSQR